MGSLIPFAKKFGGIALPDNSTHKHRIQIPSSDGSRSYIVAMNNRGGADQGRWECGCPGWVRARGGVRKPCKHLRAMLPTLSQLPGTQSHYVGF